MLMALAHARRKVPWLTLTLVGDGPERGSLEELRHALGLPEGAVRLLGERHDVPRLLAASDIFLLTSDHEGFPNVVLEAMAARLPVVTTAAGDAGTVVVEGQTGYLVGRDDESGMAHRLVELALDPIRRQVMGLAGRERVGQHYSCRGLGNRFLRILLSAANRSRRILAAQALEALCSDIAAESICE
jgi:glycosyltransferase involved in cell wall biosynthesis